MEGVRKVYLRHQLSGALSGPLHVNSHLCDAVIVDMTQLDQHTHTHTNNTLQQMTKILPT